MPQNTAPARSTEGPRPGAVARGRPGRPRGSKNKPKSLVPKELAQTMLLAMKDQLPQEHFDYLKGVIQDGKAISTKQELDTLILLLSRNLYPALISETNPENLLPEDATDEERDAARKRGPVMRRDVTERLKVLNSLLGLRNQIDKREEGGDEGGDKPILKLWADRDLDGRIAVLVQSSSSAAGTDDRTGREADGAGAVPDSVLERPLGLPLGEQE